MKKLKLLLLFITLTTTLLNAQEMRFGIKGGLNIADVSVKYKYDSGTETFDTKSILAYNGGVFVEILLADLNYHDVFVEIGANYSLHGAESHSDFRDTDTQTKFHQLNIPVALKYEIVDNLLINAGSYVGFILSANRKYELEGNTENEDAKEEFKNTDAGIFLGTEYNLYNGLLFFANYNFGLMNIASEESSVGKNRVIQIGIGYKF